MLFQILQVSNVLLYMQNKKDTRGKIVVARHYRSKQTGKPYWAFQVDWNLPKPSILRKGVIPLPIPEQGVILHGFELSTSYLDIQKLDNPENFKGVICHYRVNEITRTAYDDEYCDRSIYIEGGTRIGNKHAKSFKSLMERIYLDEQAELREQNNYQSKPESLITEKTLGDGTPITIKSKIVDHHSNRKEVATNLMRKEYPNLFHAHDGLKDAHDENAKSKWAEKARQGFIVDFKKNTGIQLNAEDATELLKDNDFIKILNEANEKPGKKQNIVAWEIIIYWIKKGYYKMKNQDLAAAVFKATGEKLKGTTLAKRVGRLGLKTALKRGRPEKKEELF